MSALDFIANEELQGFGFPWHGLFVAPLDGASYVMLPSGRRIYADAFTDYVSARTYLVDLGLPEPSIQPADPEASLWNRYIASGYGTQDFFNAWGGIAGIRQRRVRVGEDLPLINLDIFYSETFGTVFSAQLFFQGASRKIDISNVPAAALGEITNVGFTSTQILDITPDGRRWIIALQKVVIDNEYQISFSNVEPYGTQAIVELVFDEDFLSGAVSVLAGVEECITGTGITEEFGAELTSSEIWLVANENQPWREYGSTEPPSPPYVGVDQPGWPQKLGRSFGEGTSIAKSQRDVVAGAWYSPAGVPQLVTLRIKTTKTLTARKPVEGDLSWWSPFVDEYEYDVSAQVGGGGFVPFFRAGGSIVRTPLTTTYEARIGTEKRTSVVQNVSPRGPFGEVIGAYSRAVPAQPSRFSGAVAGSSASEAQVSWYAGYFSSNNTLSCMGKYSRGVRSSEFFEYIAGPVISPAGVDSAVIATGNLVPGHYRSARGFSQALFDSHRNFQAASYNPVTGQLERNRLGGDYFTWV